MNASLASHFDTDERGTSASPNIVDMVDKKYGPQSLVVRAVAVCLFNGMTANEIATELGLTVEEVRAVSEASATKARLKNLLISSDPVRLANMLKAAAIDGVLAVRELISSNDDAVRYKASAYVIDRTLGVKALSKRGLESHEMEDPEAAAVQLKKQIAEARKQLESKNI